MPLALALPLAVLSVLAVLYALVHDANTRRARARASQTSRPAVQQRPGRDPQSVLDQPWWENA